MTRTAILFVWSIATFAFVVGQTNAVRPTPPDIACGGHADGLYVTDPHACTDGFYKCANGRSFYYQCPTGLFFSTEDAQCEYKETVPACGGVRPVKQAIVQQPIAAVASVHQMVAPAIPAQPIAPIYPISYVASTAGPQLVNPVAFVQSSYEQPQAYQQPAAPVAVQQPQQYQQQTNASPAFQASIQTTQPSTETPTTTQPVYTTKATTPAPQYQAAPQAPISLVATPAEYSVLSQQTYSQSPAPTAPVAVAASQSAPMTPVAVQQVQYQQLSAPVAPQAPAQTTQTPVDFDCGNNADGYYFKQPCTPTFYSCVGGQAIKLTCASGTVYDPAVQSCDYSDVCGKPRPPSTTTQQPPPTAPPSTACVGKTDGYHQKGQCQNAYLYCSSGIASEIQCPSQLAFDGVQCTYLTDCMNPTSPAPVAVQTTTVPAPPRSQWCQQNGKSEGTFGHGCSTKFYACGGGFTTEINCPAGLFYDQATSSCDQQQFIAACGGNRPVTTTTVVAPVAPVKPVNFNCAGKPDGYHNSGCSNYYYSCNGGTASQFTCPANTRYSPQLNSCDWAQNIPECGGQLPTTTVSAPIAPVAAAVGNIAPQSYGYQSPIPSTPAAVQQPQYEQPAAPVAVQTQPTTTFSPPTAPVYTPPSTTAQAPVYQQPSTTQSPVYQPPATTAAAIYPVAPAQPIAPATKSEDYETNPCQKLADGIYGRRCSRHYFVCSVNKTYEFTCPGGYAYDRQLARCGPKSGIANCSSATAVAAPQAAVAPSG